MKVLVEEISLIIVRSSQGGVKGDSWRDCAVTR